MKSTIDHLTKLAEQIKQITEAEVHRGSIYGPSFDRNEKAQMRKEAKKVNDWYRQDSEKEKDKQEKLTTKSQSTPGGLAKYVQEAEQHQYQPMPGDTVSFDINEELEITAEVTDIVADGVVLNLDETALRLLGGLTLITEEYDQSHGSPYDRGSADSHYGRDKKPHRWWDKLGQQREELTDPADIAAYHAGYDENQRSGDKKQWDESDSTSHGVMGLHGRVNEAEYHGRDVALGKPMRTSGGPKKFSVYVRDPKTGNVKKVNFGDPNMEIKRDDPARRKNFRARHGCGTGRASNRTKAAYWSCKMWSKKPVSKIVKEELEYQINEVSDEGLAAMRRMGLQQDHEGELARANYARITGKPWTAPADTDNRHYTKTSAAPDTRASSSAGTQADWEDIRNTKWHDYYRVAKLYVEVPTPRSSKMYLIRNFVITPEDFARGVGKVYIKKNAQSDEYEPVNLHAFSGLYFYAGVMPLTVRQAYNLFQFKKKSGVAESEHTVDEVQVNETIVKRGDEYCVVSKSKDSKGHHKNLGCSDTQAGAKRRMGQVEYFKHQGEDSAD